LRKEERQYKLLGRKKKEKVRIKIEEIPDKARKRMLNFLVSVGFSGMTALFPPRYSGKFTL
jgi:hypothetical protein